MNPRRTTLAIVVVAALLVGAFMAARWRESRSFFETRNLLSRFPAEDAAIVSIEFSSLRLGGFLGQPKAALEPEYRAFVEGTGFDYRRDLDSVVATFGPSGNYFIARGRFQWDRLRAYAKSQGGGCYEQLCRMQGSTPERRISFLPLRDDAIAIGVSNDDLAATKLTKPGKVVDTALPEAPAWMLITGNTLRKQNALPAGMRLLLSALTRADRMVVKVGPAGAAVEATIDATCRSTQDAGMLLSQLKNATTMLKEAAARDKSTQQDSLIAVLMTGNFTASDKQVTGRWPIGRNVLDHLTDGI